jgi:hypothetical protein
MNRPSIASCSIFFILAVAVQSALAQAKSEKIVSRDELRACMNSESDLATRRMALDPRSKAVRDEADAIRAEAAQMAEEQKRVEDDQTRMERFNNRKVKPHNARVQVAQANQAALRADFEALNQSLIAYNDKCGGITYSKEDKDAILKERETAKK